MASQNFTWLFGDDINYEAGTVSTLRTEILFGRPADGYSSTDYKRSEELYRNLCKRMANILKEYRDDDFMINFGGEIMTDMEIKETMRHDALFVLLSAALVIILLAISTRSVFLTIAGTFQLLVRLTVFFFWCIRRLIG